MRSSSHLARAEQVRELAARTYQLAEMMSQPPRSIAQAERNIHEGEDIAAALRRVFR